MFKYELGQIVKVGENKVKGVIVGRELHEDVEGIEISYRVFNKRGECSQFYLEDEIHVI